MKPTMVLTTTAQLSALSNTKRFAILKALVHEKLNAATLATRVNLKVSQLYYHLKELELLGLIEVVETAQVRNLTEKTYRATASHFSLDRDLIPSSSQGHDIIVGVIDGIFQMTLDEVAVLLEQNAIRQHDHSLWHMHRGINVPVERREELLSRLLALLADFEPTHDDTGSTTNFAVTMVGYASGARGIDEP